MLDNTVDTTVDEVLDEGLEESSQETTETTATTTQDSEVATNDPEKERLQRELSRLRAAQSAADKRAAQAEAEKQRVLEATKRSQYGDNEAEYYKNVAAEQAKKAAELELRVQVNDLLEEFPDTKEFKLVKEAVRTNPVGFIGNAVDVPSAIINVQNYLTTLASKVETQTEDQPTGKQFTVRQNTPRTSIPSTKPKSLDEAVSKIVDSGLFS